MPFITSGTYTGTATRNADIYSYDRKQSNLVVTNNSTVNTLIVRVSDADQRINPSEAYTFDEEFTSFEIHTKQGTATFTAVATGILSDVETLKAQTANITDDMQNLILEPIMTTNDWELGSYVFSDGTAGAAATNRIRTKEKRFFEAGTTIEITSPYWISIRIYNAKGEYIDYSKPTNMTPNAIPGNVGWFTEKFTLRTKCWVHLVIRNETDTAVNIAEAISGLKITQNNLRSYQHSQMKLSFPDYYVCPDFNDAGIDFTTKTPEDLTTTELYTLYDALVTAQPSRISRTLLGYAKKADDSQGFPIYEYTIVPPLHSHTFDITYNGYSVQKFLDMPKILISSGIHGLEKAAVYSTYAFVKRLVLDYATDQQMQDIRLNSIVKVIPLVNPEGYDINSRDNPNGVDLNRNFTYNWANQTTGDPITWGSAPLSEVETQIYSQWLANNKEAILHIDFHTTLSNLSTYMYTQDIYMQKLFRHLVRVFFVKWGAATYNYNLSNQTIAFLSMGYNANATNEALNVYNIRNSCTIEFSPSDQGVGGNPTYTANVHKVGTELLVNLILHYLYGCKV